MSNAFLYPVYPALSVPLKSKPNKFAFADVDSYAAANVLSAPVNLGFHGAIPSSPPWKGTENFNWSEVGPAANVASIDALKAPVHNPELACPVWLSKLNAPAPLASVIFVKGFNQFLLSVLLSSNFHPKCPFVL